MCIPKWRIDDFWFPMLDLEPTLEKQSRRIVNKIGLRAHLWELAIHKESNNSIMCPWNITLLYYWADCHRMFPKGIYLHKMILDKCKSHKDVSCEVNV